MKYRQIDTPPVAAAKASLTTQLTLLYALDAAIIGLEKPVELLRDLTTNMGVRSLLEGRIHELERVHSDLRDLAPPSG